MPQCAHQSVISKCLMCSSLVWSFPAGSEVKASACNAGDSDLIPGLGRSPWDGNGNPLQYSCLENPRDRGAWWAAVYGVTQSWTRLKQLSSSSSSRQKGDNAVLLPLLFHFFCDRYNSLQEKTGLPASVGNLANQKSCFFHPDRLRPPWVRWGGAGGPTVHSIAGFWATSKWWACMYPQF